MLSTRVCLSFILAIATMGYGQTASAPVIDWTKLDPQILDLAFDDVDALDRAADLIEEPDAVFIPVHEESKKIEQKIRRFIESDADRRIYGDIVDFSFGLSLCRIRFDEAKCNISALTSLRDKASKDLKADRLMYLAATKKK